ncbi:prolyl-tRNA synthetase [Phlyctema vagabunda]|uniref:proline--tRNA ligase n=1 Tax=Phlyctema vagabunda TaxID=108571 RepID=A0ABR4PBN1_9HELO
MPFQLHYTLTSSMALSALRKSPFPVHKAPLPCAVVSRLPNSRPYSSLKAAHRDGRARLSRVWAPSGGIAESSTEDAHAKLIRAGFLRQAHSGIFHLLPLGLRVKVKLEALIDKHMSHLGASKLDLSSISSEELWAKSGRLNSAGSELFHFKDRKDAAYLLSPTHEEEVTSLVSSTIKSYKELPIRVYQTSRKYRDELRPRHGILRSREFVMKDLYTFDYSVARALATYHEVRGVYKDLFDELKIPYMVAEADSGDMGGNLSHEFHFPTSQGEDNIISCDKCAYAANEELAECAVKTSDNNDSQDVLDIGQVHVWRGISRDRNTLVNTWYLRQNGSSDAEVNVHKIRDFIPDLDASLEDPESYWKESVSSESKSGSSTVVNLVNIIDHRVPESLRAILEAGDSRLPIWPAILERCPPSIPVSIISRDDEAGKPRNLIRIQTGDSCPRCPDGSLKVQKAIELGHTFYLGTRYSEPLQAEVMVPVEHLEQDQQDPQNQISTKLQNQSRSVAMQMGCHGIGVSRIIGAVADTLADDRGLNWPRVMAPFEVAIVPGKGLDEAATEVYDHLHSAATAGEAAGNSSVDLVLDDRSTSFPWKMRDADLVGYPIIVVVGRSWKSSKTCEVQCRRLQIREEVHLDSLSAFIHSTLEQL